MTSTPPVNVQSQEFLEAPNAALGCPHARLAHQEGISGTEFFRYETVRQLFREDRVRPKTAQVYRDMGVEDGSPILDFLENGNFNMMSQEGHDRLRPLVLKGFRPARIKKAEPTIQDIATGLVDQMLSRGSTANLVHDYSHHVSIQTISSFVGVPPEDVHRFEDATVELILLGAVPFAPVIPTLEEALRQIFDYVDSLVDARRHSPSEDFISDLTAIQAQGEKLSQSELVWSIVFLLLAGHDTTRAQIASTARMLLEAGLWEKAAEDRTIVPKAVREALRLYPAAHRFPRIVLEDIELEDMHFTAGDRVAMNLVAAARDPEVFDHPDEVDLDRPEPGWDLGFGFGSHHCIGWALATSEITIGVQTLVDRLTDVTLTDPVVYKVGGTIGGPEYVNVSFRSRESSA